MPRAIDLRQPPRDHDPLANLLDFGNIDATVQQAGNLIRGYLDSLLQGVVTIIKDLTGIDLSDITTLLDDLFTETGLNLTELGAALAELDFTTPEAFYNSLVEAIGDLLNIDTSWLLITPEMLPIVPLTSIGEISPNLLENPTFEDAVSLEGESVWFWDDTQTHSPTGGSARTALDGTGRELLSNSIAVTEGNQLAASHWLKWSGVAGTGTVFRLAMAGYLGGTYLGEIAVADIDNPAASSGWVLMQNSTPIDIPAGVDAVRLHLEVLPAGTAGTVWWDDGSVTKTQKLPQDYVTDLVADMQARIDEWTELLEATAGQVGAGLADVWTRLTGLKSDGSGQFDARKLFEKAPIGAIPADELTILNVPDLGQIVRDIKEYIFPPLGTDPLTITLDYAREALDTHWRTTTSNAEALKELQATGSGASNSGIAIHPRFANHPNSAEMPNPAVIAEPGLGGWVTTYSAVPGKGAAGTSTLGINAGHTHAYLVNNGFRRAVTHHPVPTTSRYQRFSNVVNLGPAGQSESSVICRCNAANSSYVYVKVREVGFLSYTAELGYVVAVSEGGTGLDNVLVPAKAVPAAADSTFYCGTGNGERNFQFFVGSSLIFNHTEIGTGSKSDDSHLFWGIRGDMSGAHALSQGVTMDMSDNAPPSVVGSGATISRRSTGLMGIGGAGPAPWPASFYDNIVNRSADVTPNLTNGSLTVSNAGWYLVHVNTRLSSNTLDTTFAIPLYKNGSLLQMGCACHRPQFAVGASFMVYLEAGDILTTGYYVNATGFVNFTGDTGDVYTYFDIALVNRSLQ